MTVAPSTARKTRALLRDAAIFVVLAVWMTWPLARHPATTVYDPGRAGPLPEGVFPDIPLNIWIVGWIARTLCTAPWRLFDGPIFHPTPHTIALSEHMLGATPLTVPAYWLGGSPVFAAQLLLIGGFALGGLAMARLVRDWGGGDVAAIVAGTIYAFSPWRLVHLVSLQIQPTFYFPLVLLFAARYQRDGRPGDLVLAAVLLFAQAACAYSIAYPLVASTPVFVATLGAATGRWRRAAITLSAFAAALLAFALVSLPYLDVHRAGLLSMTRWTEPDKLIAFTGVGPGAYVARGSPVFLGHTALVLALAGTALGLARPGRRPLVLGLLAFAATLVVLALGPGTAAPGDEHASPAAFLWATIPGLRRFRVAYRFGFHVSLAVAALAGIGIATMEEFLAARLGRSGRRLAIGLGVVLVAGVLWESAIPIRARPLPEAGPPAAAYVWLRDHGDDGGRAALLELPAGLPDGVDARYLLPSLFHRLPLVNGYSGYQPASYPVVVGLAAELPGTDALHTLAAMTGLRWLLVHLATLPPGQRIAWEGPAGGEAPHRFGDDLLFEVAEPGADWQERMRHPIEDTTLGGTPLAPLPVRRATIVATIPTRVAPGIWLPIAVITQNTGDRAWPALASDVPNRVSLAIRWAGTERDRSVLLPEDVAPGGTTTATAWLPMPATEGVHALEIRLIQSGVGPFTLGTGDTVQRFSTQVVRASPP